MPYSPANGKTIIIKREAELMDPIKANTESPEASQHKQSKVNSVIPQVSLTRTQFKETSIWDVSSQLMKLQRINIQDTTTTLNEVLMLVEVSSHGFPTEKFSPDQFRVMSQYNSIQLNSQLLQNLTKSLNVMFL